MRRSPRCFAGCSAAPAGSGRLGFLSELRQLLGLVLGSERRDQLVNLTIHDLVDLVEGEVDAMVGHPPLREIVGADALGAVAAADQGLARGRRLRLLVANLLVLDARGENAERPRPVLV